MGRINHGGTAALHHPKHCPSLTRAQDLQHRHSQGVSSGKLMGMEDLQGRAGFRRGRAKQRVIYRVSSNLHSR